LQSFMGAPHTWDLNGAKAAVLGLPFDAGTHPVRIGARLGPSAIREQSALVRRYEPPMHDFDPVKNLGLIDCGNARVVPGVIEQSFATIEEAVWRIASQGVIPVTMAATAWSACRSSEPCTEYTLISACFISTPIPMLIRMTGRVNATATIRGQRLPVPRMKGWSTPVNPCTSVPVDRRTNSVRSTRRSIANTA
jgi:hypothetical protein